RARVHPVQLRDVRGDHARDTLDHRIDTVESHRLTEIAGIETVRRTQRRLDRDERLVGVGVRSDLDGRLQGEPGIAEALHAQGQERVAVFAQGVYQMLLRVAAFGNLASVGAGHGDIDTARTPVVDPDGVGL